MKLDDIQVENQQEQNPRAPSRIYAFFIALLVGVFAGALVGFRYVFSAKISINDILEWLLWLFLECVLPVIQCYLVGLIVSIAATALTDPGTKIIPTFFQCLAWIGFIFIGRHFAICLGSVPGATSTEWPQLCRPITYSTECLHRLFEYITDTTKWQALLALFLGALLAMALYALLCRRESTARLRALQIVGSFYAAVGFVLAFLATLLLLVAVPVLKPVQVLHTQQRFQSVKWLLLIYAIIALAIYYKYVRAYQDIGVYCAVVLFVIVMVGHYLCAPLPIQEATTVENQQSAASGEEAPVPTLKETSNKDNTSATATQKIQSKASSLGEKTLFEFGQQLVGVLGMQAFYLYKFLIVVHGWTPLVAVHGATIVGDFCDAAMFGTLVVAVLWMVAVLWAVATRFDATCDRDPTIPSESAQTQEIITEQACIDVPLGGDPKYVKYFNLLKVGMPMEAVKYTMGKDGLDPSILEEAHIVVLSSRDHPKFAKFLHLLKVGMPMEAVKHAMEKDGLDPSILEQVELNE